MYSRIGVHVIKGTSVALGHPPIVVLYNCDTAYYRQVRAKVGDDTIIVFRTGGWPHDHVVAAIAHERTVLQTINEPVIDTPQEASRLCVSELGRMQFVHELGGHYCIFNFAVGNPANFSLWQYLVPAIGAMQPGDYVGLHAYWGIDPTNTWHVSRWQHVPELRDVPIICTEGGRDVVEGQGWPGWKGHVNREQYLGEIETVNGILERFPNVHGYALYTLGAENDPKWRDFAIDDIWPSIRYSQVPEYIPPVVPELTLPVPGARVSQRFGERPEYYAPLGYPGGHPGVDLATPTDTDALAWHGTPVHSMSDGRLLQCESDGYGLYAYVVNEDEAWCYCHLACVAAGNEVYKGDVVGWAGYSGNCKPAGVAGCHVHVGWRPKPYAWDNGYRGYKDWLKGDA